MYKFTFNYEVKGKPNRVSAIGATPTQAKELARDCVIDIYGAYFAPLVLKYAKRSLIFQGASRGIIGKVV